MASSIDAGGHANRRAMTRAETETLSPGAR